MRENAIHFRLSSQVDFNETSERMCHDGDGRRDRFVKNWVLEETDPPTPVDVNVGVASYTIY